MERVDWWRVRLFNGWPSWQRHVGPECPYDELATSLRFPGTSMSLPARLLLCEGYARVAAVPFGDYHESAHETAMALACGDIS